MKRFSFSKKDRIKKKDDFKKIFNEGFIYKSRFYIFFYKKNCFEFSRLGIIIKKKLISNAVERNYEKRIIREFFRLNKENNFDIIVVVKKNKKNYIDKKEDFDAFIKDCLK